MRCVSRPNLALSQISIASTSARTNSKTFLCIAAVLLIAALVLAFVAKPFLVERSTSGPVSVAPNVLMGLASLGLSIAGGLSLLSAAVLASRTPPRS